MREDRSARRRRKAARRRERLSVDLTVRPLATFAALLGSGAADRRRARLQPLACSISARSSGRSAIEWWRYLAAPFVYDDLGYLFACGLAIAIFLPGIERRIGSFASVMLVLGCGALGMLAADAVAAGFGDGIPVASGGNGIALGVVAAWVVLRDAERRADPTDEYDRVAVAVVGDRAPAVAAGRGLRRPVGGDRRRPDRRLLRPRGGARRPDRRPMSKFTPLTDELHAYMVDHGARQDEVLHRVQEETAAMGDDRGDADRARPGRLHDPDLPADRRPRGDRARHLHRLLGDLHRPRACPRRSADRLRALRGVRRDRRRRTSSAPGSPTGSRSGSARRSRRCAAMPERELFDFGFIDADKPGYPEYYELVLARMRTGRPDRGRQRARRAARSSAATPTTGRASRSRRSGASTT